MFSTDPNVSRSHKPSDTGSITSSFPAGISDAGVCPGFTVPPGYCVALVDVDSMFVSCEQIFDPHLWGKPVVVLSNNDGCVIARSREAKQLGISMCQPWFEITAIPSLARKVIPRSGNYALYSDISHRLMSILEDFTPYVQVYSIDEAFLLLPQEDACRLAQTIRTTIDKWLNIPVTIGIGATKTLAKVAAYHAKTNPRITPVCIVEAATSTMPLGVTSLSLDCLAVTPVQEVWGVGRRLMHRFVNMGIETAAQLQAQDPRVIRKKFSLIQERTVRELNQQPCIMFYDDPPIKQQLTYSRLFGKPVTTRDDMAYVLASYADKAARRLRSKHLVAGVVSISASTSRHSGVVYRNHCIVRLYAFTSNTSDIIRAAHKLLPHIHEGVRYTRANITLSELYPEQSPTTLCDTLTFPTETTPIKKGNIYHYASASSPTHPCNEIVDTIVQRFGHQAIGYGHSGVKKQAQWDTRHKYLSPAYSTRWSELLEIQ